MSTAKSLLTITNIAYLIGAIYFIAVSATNQATPYSISAAILCIISIPLALQKDWFFSAPFRVATAAYAVTLFATQIIFSSGNSSLAGSLLVNGSLLLVFLGVLLSALHGSVKKESEEEKEEEAKAEELEKKRREAKKLTYEV